MMTTVGPDLVACFEREVPSLPVLGLSVLEHARYDGFGLFGVERRGWVSRPHELGIVSAGRGACKVPTARTQDAPGLADGDERVGDVVQTPQVRHFCEHSIAKRELPHVCEDHRPVRVGSQLGGRRVDANA
jgi:hypothetical protein